MDFKVFFESSFAQLYQNTIDAWPNTTKRQHAIDPVVISDVKIIPFLGVRTLFVKGLATNENREYNTIALFKEVNYSNDGDATIEVDGKDYKFDKPNLSTSNILVRCGCDDFNWRICHYNYIDKSLYGRDRKPYTRVEGSTRPPANPYKLPALCKHLIRFFEELFNKNLVSLE